MGSNQSSRKITVTNDNAHIIKVSESVIERLKNVDVDAAKATVSKSPAPTSPSVLSTPVLTGTTGVTLTSLQVLQEKEKQLKDNDAYWSERVNKLEKNQASVIQRMEEEFQTTVTQLNNRLPKLPGKISELPCSDKEAKVLECYKKNPKQILLCSGVVAEFAGCVDQRRLAMS